MTDKREEMKNREEQTTQEEISFRYFPLYPQLLPASRMTVLLHLTAQSPTHHLPLPFSLPVSNTLAICLFIFCSLHLRFLSPGSSLSSINFLQASTFFSLSFTSSENVALQRHHYASDVPLPPPRLQSVNPSTFLICLFSTCVSPFLSLLSILTKFL